MSRQRRGGTASRESRGKAGIRPDREVLERGDLFFAYRPDVDQEAPQHLLEVSRFHMILRPESGDVLRLITIGRKTLPDMSQGDQNHWGFVQSVFRSADELREALGEGRYQTETQGERHVPAARPAGEGVYALFRQGRNSIFAYALELPAEPGEVQDAFGIAKQGQFVLAVKNPDAPRPAGIGLNENQQAEYPAELKARFGARKWIAADPPDFLDYEGTEFVLIAGRDQLPVDLEIELDREDEDEESAEVFRDLNLEKSERTIRPLFEGDWA
jgi:hypothetical protein